MIKSLKPAAAVVAAAALFASCNSEGIDNYVSGETSSAEPEVIITDFEVSTTEGYDYIFDSTNMIPGNGSGEFAVYVKNAKPAKVNLKTSKAGVTFTAFPPVKTDKDDPVGTGSYKLPVHYEFASDFGTETVTGSNGNPETVPVDLLQADLTLSVQFSNLDPVENKVLVKGSYIKENAGYKLSNISVTGQKEHEFTLNWTLPEKTIRDISYEVYAASSSGEGSGKTYAKSGEVLESGKLPVDAAGFTTSSPAKIPSLTEYYVEIKVIGSDGWYTSGTSQILIATTDDITPPPAPAVTLTGVTEETVTLKYAKAGENDDTKFLVIAIESQDATPSSIPAPEDAVQGYTAGKGLDVSSVTGETSITITGLERASRANRYTITVHAVDAKGNSSTDNEEGKRTAVISATTTADTDAPVLDASKVSFYTGFESAKVTWEEPNVPDFAGVYLVKDGESITASTPKVLKGKTYYIFSDKAADAGTWKLYAFDAINNTDAEANATVPVEFQTFEVKAEPIYSNTIQVTWTDLYEYSSNGTRTTTTYTVSGTGPTPITSKAGLTDGAKGFNITGLVVSGDDEDKYTFTVTPAGKSGTDTESLNAQRVLWRISTMGTYNYNSGRLWLITAGLTSGPSSGTHVIEEFTGNNSPSAENFIDGFDAITYTYWLVYPVVQEDGLCDSFKLMASTASGEETGLYMYLSTTKDVGEKWYYAKHWSASGHLTASAESPHFFVGAETDEDFTEAAVFKENLTTGYSLQSAQAGYLNRLFYLTTTLGQTEYNLFSRDTIVEGSKSSKTSLVREVTLLSN